MKENGGVKRGVNSKVYSSSCQANRSTYGMTVGFLVLQPNKHNLRFASQTYRRINQYKRGKILKAISMRDNVPYSPQDFSFLF